MIDTKAIRAQILRLAFSAQLTTHHDDDDDVSSLLSSINSKKNIEQTEDIPYEIPDYWKWVKLSDLYEINPKVEADNNADAAFIPMEKISAGFERTFSFEVMNWEKAAKNHTKFQDGDVAFAKISPCFENRKSFVAENLPNSIGGGTTELIVLRQKYVYPLYTYYLVNDQRFIKAGSGSYKGIVGQQRVKSDVVKDYLIPLPPLAEQKRIVERVEEIFRLLDTIDKAQEKYSADSQILKAKLITAGIQGKLTKQLESDGTAHELYQQIQEEKQKLIKESKIKKEKPLPPISPDEIPFEIPQNWMWVRLQDIGSTNIGLTYHPTDISNNGTIVIRSSNIQNGKMDYSDIVRVDCKINENQYLNHNDIVICARNGSKSLVGKNAIYDGESNKVAFGAFMAVYRTICFKFVYYYFNTFAFKRYFSGDDSKQINQVTQAILKESVVPLPPLAEQKRIADVLERVLGEIE